MKFRLGLTAVLLCCLASTAFAADLGPLQFLLTKEEAAAWKNVKSDADAQAFLDLFWARRDPTPGTPQNEYRAEIEARIKYADEQFNRERVRGALTERGRALIVLGAPQRVDRTRQGEGANIDMNSDLQRDQALAEAVQRWTYEGEGVREVFGLPRAELRFIDRSGRDEKYVLEPSRIDIPKARERAIARSITQPNLTSAPAMPAQAPAPVSIETGPVAATTPIVTELTTEAFRTAVGEKDRAGHAAWGEFVTSFGQTFVPVGVLVPKSAGLTGPDVTLFGVVRDANGKNVLAFEEPVKATETKGDWFVDHTLTLPAGKYRGTFGVAQNDKVVAVASSEMDVAGTLDKDATAISPLILSNNVFPLAQPQKPTDPFAFGGLRVIPKADRTFRTADELWYFVELRNPGVAEAAPSAGQVPASSAATATPLPKVQVKLDVAGKDATGKAVKMAAPPREMEAIELRGVPGHFAIGNALPPNTFKPGEYTLTIKIIDTIKKASYTLTDKFKVVE
ncbi:MAG TPA: GWxTD domain-containing protein [Thermoanaerobaculia bacterium]|nr:GWxTD domain-containing protein [Thermoanaerobaculia bacterium]